MIFMIWNTNLNKFPALFQKNVKTTRSRKINREREKKSRKSPIFSR